MKRRNKTNNGSSQTDSQCRALGQTAARETPYSRLWQITFDLIGRHRSLSILTKLVELYNEEA